MTIGLLLAWAAGAAAESQPLTADACVAIAMRQAARIHAAQADADGLHAQAAQVEAEIAPRFSALAFVSPMFGADGGPGFGKPYQHDLKRWGPYGHAEARIVQPLYTFGRYSNGLHAARERAAAEDENVREVSHAVRREVRRLYGLRLYARSLQPTLESTRKILTEAIAQAEEMHARGTGEVTLPDLMRLQYGAGEIERYSRQAGDGGTLAARALGQAMGLPVEAPMEFADDRLTLESGDVPSVETLVAEAVRNRPETAQLRHAREAVAAWETSERRANAPALFVAAAGQVDASPVRPRETSAVAANAYNDYFVGAAVGAQFNTNFGSVSAHAAEAHAKAEWVRAESALAETGIPLQVWKARQELLQHRDLAAVADREVVHTRKWMTFAAAAYGTGTGEAKDVLEGAAAHVMAKKAYYDHLLAASEAAADLEQAVGRP